MASDVSIISVLTEVGMMKWVTSRGGLDTALDTNRLSSGKQQLRPVARVLLDQSQILVLDEATPLVDHATERNITDLVREKFQDRTVVAVAHRLRLIRHFDVVVVMEEGKIIKTGLPTQLLQDPGSRFRDKWLKEGGDPV
ncbi:P-loop containing nucleoside triphosphate hydrolase protein [Aspergillus alliaceus]|uniref:P-loop containing nucleoside triphosphate hydrolase protein n=1 Tax=Petromyces alliaceus TaxID=209559 RepID=A0A5N7C4D4_PETAA|nr:P-loop containing nucleoside triphosphate hydrolase protein [Aspergillus alliaceus]